MSDKWSDSPRLIPMICENCMWDKAKPEGNGECGQCGGTKWVRAATLLPGRS